MASAEFFNHILSIIQGSPQPDEQQTRQQTLESLGLINICNPEKTTGTIFTIIVDEDIAKWEWYKRESALYLTLDLENLGASLQLLEPGAVITLTDLRYTLDRSFVDIVKPEDLIINSKLFDRVKKELLTGICEQLDVRFAGAPNHTQKI
jgi:hypothetical protein